MFRRTSYYSTIVALAILCCAFFSHVRLRHRDLPFYRKLSQESADLRATREIEKAPILQARQRVRKDVWKDGHLCSHTESAKSDLILSQKKGKMRAVENLQEIEGWIEEEGERKIFSSDSGRFDFPQNRLTALQFRASMGTSQLHASRADFEADTLLLSGPFQVDHPMGRLMGEKGTLKNNPNRTLLLEEAVIFEAVKTPISIFSKRAFVELPKSLPLSQFPSQQIQFWDEVEIWTAGGIRAQGGCAIVHEGSLRLIPAPGASCTLLRGMDRIAAQEIRCNRETKELYLLSPEGLLEEKNTSFQADAARVIFDETDFRPHTVLLEGNVQIISLLQGKESCALADSAYIDINNQKMILESAFPRRVLFWQEGLEVSAPTVHIQDTIKGLGDVRFYFEPNEKTTIDTFVSKYL